MSRLAVPPRSLLPPYAHSLPRASPSLAPPYSHTIKRTPKPTAPPPSLKPTVRFRIVQPRTSTATKGSSIEAEALRVRWIESIKALKQKSGNQTPDFQFHALASHVAGGLREKMCETGAAVVRGVVPEAEAAHWGQEIEEAELSRNGSPLYYHPAQIASRAHPSILVTNLTILSSLNLTAPYIQVDSLSYIEPSLSVTDPWITECTVPLHAYVAVKPTIVEAQTSVHAATYACLRPHFTPKRSLISFYDRAEYLADDNWTFARGSTDSSDFPHLGSPVSIQLSPGDMILLHPSLPSSSTARLLPVHSLSSADVAKEQREAFENGVPPPHVEVQGAVAVEQPGNEASIASWGGKKAMGY